MNRPWQDTRVQRGMDLLLKKRRERVAAGDRAIGWKIAFGAKAIQDKLGISGPLVGALFGSQSLASGGTASLAGWGKPIAEPEIAAYMARELAPGLGAAEAAAAVEKLAPAWELIDSPAPPSDPEAVLGGNIAHRYAVFGAAGKADLGGLKGRISRRGAKVAETEDVRALPGDPYALLAYVADYLAAFGERLRAGDVVICGSIVAPIPIEAEDDSLDYLLDPVGEASVRFSR